MTNGVVTLAALIPAINSSFGLWRCGDANRLSLGAGCALWRILFRRVMKGDAG